MIGTDRIIQTIRIMQTRPEEYRASARECLRQTQWTADAEVRQTLLALAARWHAMADRIEARERAASEAVSAAAAGQASAGQASAA